MTGTDQEKLERAVGSGLIFLKNNQLSSGEFKSYRSTHPTMEDDCEPDSSPFPTALITYSLSFSDSSQAKEMIEKAVNFFLSEMEKGSVWRYWTAQHPYHKNIPPDLDDISYISAILESRSISFQSNKKLILANQNRHGLFYTWIIPRLIFNISYWRTAAWEALKPLSLYYFWKLNESSPDDVDCVVNANVLFYLGERKETAPVIDYLIQVIRNKREGCCDKWHLNRFTFYYALTRNYFVGINSLEVVRREVIGRIISSAKTNGMIGDNVLDTALAACALLNLNVFPVELERAVAYLIEQQEDSGFWKRIALYYGGPKKYYGWGSEELTTGFCLEVLIRRLQHIKDI